MMGEAVVDQEKALWIWTRLLEDFFWMLRLYDTLLFHVQFLSLSVLIGMVWLFIYRCPLLFVMNTHSTVE